MPAALTLEAAAGQAFDNLQIRWLANQLRTNLTLFWQQTLPTFPQGQAEAHPVSNWLTVLAALSSQLPATNVPIDQLTLAAEAVYRLCWMASFLQDSGGISSAQGTVILSAYNVLIAV